MKYIACVFLKEGLKTIKKSPMNGVDYHTIDSGMQYIDKYLKKGISNFLVFASTSNKSVDYACRKGIVRKFIKTAKSKYKNKIVLYSDVGLSPYAKDGHSTIISKGKIDYKKSYEAASKLAIAFAEAGTDYIAPCLSLPQQVGMLRKALDKNDYKKTKIMAYSAKFSSALYGPYRETIQSPLGGSDRKSYQTDYSDDRQALRQIKLDEKQGADIVMVKPAMLYLDIVYRARQLTELPLSVYHVSGEYSMIKEGERHRIIDENEVFDEVHSAFNRCKVDFVIGYAPDHFLRWNKAKKSKSAH